MLPPCRINPPCRRIQTFTDSALPVERSSITESSSQRKPNAMRTLMQMHKSSRAFILYSYCVARGESFVYCLTSTVSYTTSTEPSYTMLTCLTSIVPKPRTTTSVTVYFDDDEKKLLSGVLFNYTFNPNITSINPKASYLK